jgi:CheY-like chemotaxis protein
MAAILVVDDNPDLCDMLVRLLRLSGFAAAGVEDGAAALDAVRTTPPSLVILDVTMPGMDGFDVLRALRDDPVTAGVPVVMYTALNDASARGRAMAMGAQDYLVKGATTFHALSAVVGRYAGPLS